MKKILLILSLLTVGIVGKVFAGVGDGFYTSQSTGVLVSSDTKIEVLEVWVSTGNGSTYVLLIDSNTQTIYNTSRAPGLTASGMGVGSWVTPPIVAVTTNTYTNTVAKYDLTDKEGNGYTVKYGLNLFQSAVGPTVTIRYRKR